MTKREEIAAMILQGSVAKYGTYDYEELIADAIIIADALIEKLDEKFLPKAPVITDTHG